MSESIIVKSESKQERYKELYPQLKSLLEGEKDVFANAGNFCAALHETFRFLWTGFYFVKDDELVLGPFQGPVACTRIQKGKGVCGTAWAKRETIVVADVEKFPGHIACSTLSKSEIVIPVFGEDGEVRGVLDIDSAELNTFDETDKTHLEELVKLVRI